MQWVGLSRRYLSCICHCDLVQENGSSWAYVNAWSDSATGGNEAYASGSSTVSSGTYKVTASGNVGGGKEYPSKSVTKTK